jgi:hypothetical protein
MAERIGRLPHEVLESFQFSDPARRVARLQHVEAEILVGMHPVIGWLERRRPPDKAELVKRRMDYVLRESVQCAGLDIPEYAGGKVAQVTGEPTLGATRTATLAVSASAFAQDLLGWADDIEAEDEQEPLPRRAARQGKTTGKGKRGGGKPRLEQSNPLAFQVYKRIQQEHQPGEDYVDTVSRLKSDKNFNEQLREAGVGKLDTGLVRRALAFFDSRAREEARKKQETDPA